jgi:hypothetical protein
MSIVILGYSKCYGFDGEPDIEVADVALQSANSSSASRVQAEPGWWNLMQLLMLAGAIMVLAVELTVEGFYRFGWQNGLMVTLITIGVTGLQAAPYWWAKRRHRN